jgi:hypothetical protein
MLDSYLQTLQGFIRDRAERQINSGDLIGYVNRARREIAMRSQSVRVLTPISGPITQIQVTAFGSGYTSPTVVISAPDFPSGRATNPAGAQATATAIMVGGQIASISVSYGGDGYFQPTVTITDPTGTGATATASTSPINTTALQQEEYLFSDVNLSAFPGVGAIFAVKSVSIIYSNYRYSLPCYDFSTYQAKIRNYPTQYQYVPVVFGQYGQGTSGSLFMYPLPAQAFQMEWDTFCLPGDLEDDDQPEILPMPWQDAVPISAAVYAYEEMQNLNAAVYFQKKADEYIHRYSAYARVGRATNIYGRF